MDSAGSPTQPQDLPSDFSSILRTLDNFPVGVYLCDARGLITYFNTAAAKLWGRAPALGNPVDRWCGSFRLWDARSHQPINHDRCWMALAIRDGKPYIGEEIEVERPDGSRWIALAHANPILDSQGKVIGGINMLTDITEAKRAANAQARLSPPGTRSIPRPWTAPSSPGTRKRFACSASPPRRRSGPPSP
jgi:hypothetical protein